MGKLVMGYWDCPVCGNKEIRGDVMNCPSCGRARGDVQFYVKDVAEGAQLNAADRKQLEYLSDEKTQEMGRNPDWYCSFCNSLNRDNAAFCSNCGATRESSESNYFDQLNKRKAAEAAEKEAIRSSSGAAPQKRSRKPLLILLVVVLAIVGIVTFMNGKTTQKDLTVKALGWQRVIPIEENQVFHESGWTLPSGATQTSTKQEIHHYDQVLDHYEDVEVQKSRRVLDHYDTYTTLEDKGNGTFEEVEHQTPVYETEYYTVTESQPVYRSVARYQTKYYYDIWRWVQTRTVTASGTDHEAYWPELDLGENEREGSPRAEKYTFTVEDSKGSSRRYRLAEADWRNVNVGDGMSITAARTGANPWITDDKGNQVAQVALDN